MFRKFILFIMIGAMLLSLCGCSRIADVRLRLVVHAIGIDLSEDDTYMVSWQVFKAQPPEGGGPVDATGQNVITVVTYGRTMLEAENQLELQTGKKVFIGDTELLVFGSGFAGRDLNSVLSYFWDNSDIYMGVNTAFAEGRAADVVGMTLEHGTAATELLNEMIKSAGRNCVTIPLRMITFYNRQGDSCTFLMPVITVEKADNSAGEEDTTIDDKVVGVFKSVWIIDGRPICYFTPDEARGLSLLTNRADEMNLTLDIEGNRVGVNGKIAKIARKIEIGENGFPHISVFIKGSFTVKDNPGKVEHDKVRKSLQEEMMRFCGLAYEKTAGNLGIDALEIRKLLSKYENKYFNDNKNNISAIIQCTSYDITISMREYGRKSRA